MAEIYPICCHHLARSHRSRYTNIPICCYHLAFNHWLRLCHFIKILEVWPLNAPLVTHPLATLVLPLVTNPMPTVVAPLVTHPMAEIWPLGMLESVLSVLRQRSKLFLHLIFWCLAPFTQLHSARGMP